MSETGSDIISHGNITNLSNDASYLLGNGTYGIITAKNGSPICRKIFSKDKAFSFIREAYIIKRLSHIKGITEIVNLEYPNDDDTVAVQIGSWGNLNIPGDRKSPWGVIVMSKYSMTLKQWLRTNPSFEERFRILKEIVRILSQVHTAGIVHADIKLENVMLTETNEVRIIDWGLSGPCGYARTHLTTRTYRPKQIIQDYCHDIYSLGVLSVELLLGSILVNDMDYVACRRLVKSTNLDPYLKRLLCRMIHPNCINRPDIFEIARLFSLPVPVEMASDVMEIIRIPHIHGVITMEYPAIFSRFITKHPEMIETIYCILGAIYGCKNPSELFGAIDYGYILMFMSSL